MTTLSTHVLDIERGSPAAGVPVELYRGAQLVARGQRTNADGRVPDLAGGSVEPGTYRLVFDVAAYFAARAGAAPSTFLQRVSVDFDVSATDPHYHVPLLLSAYACTVYRGS
ncbi:MAG TPA: hydroxyisourate hydrolase [Chloroflexota bacterium]|nr:hydroxyisourate hydrolase [Chloroflexota bacterium]